MPVTCHAGGRAASDMRQHGHGVRVIFRARPTALVAGEPPAVMLALADVIDARRIIPRQEGVAFNVAVVSEDVAGGIEVEAVGIAQTMSNDLAVSVVRGNPQQRPGFRFVNRRTIKRSVLLAGETGVVAADDIEPSVRSLTDGVPAVFAEAERHQFFRRAVRHAVAIHIHVAQQPPVRRGVEGVTDKAHSHHATLHGGKRDRVISHAVVVLVDEHADGLAIAYDEATEGIKRHAPGVWCEIVAGELGDFKTTFQTQSEVRHGREVGLRDAGHDETDENETGLDEWTCLHG